MTKELDALERLRQNNKDNSHLFDDELLDIIEKSLKRLEQLEIEKQSFDRVIEKKLKALEIIKKCCLLSKHELAFTNKIEISQEEYDLLKEVLG